MILALFIFGIFSAFAAFCGLLIYGYRSRAHSAEARANRAEGALEVSQHNLNVVAEIARECVKGIGLNPKEIVPDEVLPRRDRKAELAEYYRQSQSNYTPQVAAHCPTCNVSVRHPPESYPVPCPRKGCGTLIDPVLDNPPEFDTA